MSNGRGTLRAVSWQELFPSLILLRVLRLAISPRVLLLAAVALVAMVAGWRLIGWTFSGTDDERVIGWIESQSVWPWEWAYRVGPFYAPLEPEVLDEPVDQTTIVAYNIPLIGGWLYEGPVLRVWRKLADPFMNLFHPRLSVTGLAYLLACCLWAALVWALFGGTITRIAGFALTRHEALELRPAIGFARRKWPAYFLAPLLPLVGTLLVVLPLALLGLLMWTDAGLVVGGVLWPLVLLAGLFLAILLVGLLFGWPLMWPAISIEPEGDYFDALSRAYSYVYQRPLHYLLYAFVATLLGILGVLIVNVFAALVLDLTTLAVSWGTGQERIEQITALVRGEAHDAATPAAGRVAEAGGGLIAFWVGAVRTLQVGFQFGFFWVAATAIYLLLRYHVDATELDEMHVAGEAQPLPPLQTDAAGVAGVGDLDEGQPPEAARE